MFTRRLHGPIGVLLLAAAASGCTGGGTSDGSANPAESPTSTVPANPTEAACDHFTTMWVEAAQIRHGPHGFGDSTRDPHSVPALDAADAAFAAAAVGSAEARALGVTAQRQYEGRLPGDFYATVTEFLALCGDLPPHVECAQDTVCELAHLDTYVDANDGT
jgi:hypothetical protein